MGSLIVSKSIVLRRNNYSLLKLEEAAIKINNCMKAERSNLDLLSLDWQSLLKAISWSMANQLTLKIQKFLRRMLGKSAAKKFLIGWHPVKETRTRKRNRKFSAEMRHTCCQ